MSGLLYKDFLAVKVKRILIIVLAATVLFLVLRFALPGTDTVKSYTPGTQADFSSLSVNDLLLQNFPFLGAFVFLFLPSSQFKRLFAEDEKNKIRSFTKSLPLGKNTYIASKYAFFGIMIYAALSVLIIWIEIYLSKAGDNAFTDLVQTLRSFSIILSSISLFITGIELPFFLSLGSKRAFVVKIAIVELIFFFFIGYLFFGNLDILEKMDFAALVEWTKEHEPEVNIMMVLSPVVSSVLYYLSYRLTCSINKNREADIDG